nr:class I SAM-dependent methyltransferase [Microcoleus sp. LEGE 07076]
MFSLTSTDLKLAILDCAGGPASFNAEMTRQGRKVISCDPVYQFTAVEIGDRIQETYQTVIDAVKANVDGYLWNSFESPYQLGEVRMKAMQEFLADFPSGLEQGRYINAELPILPFNDGQFDLALCSHFLFAYSHLLSEEFHLEAIMEMCRVAKEVRVFPLLQSFSGEESEHLSPIITELKNRNFRVEIQETPYEFQKGGNKMLRVRR